VPKVNGFGRSIVGAGRARPLVAKKLNALASQKAPWWCTSSPMNQSACGACGETALRAGCEPTSDVAAKKPPYEMPHAPTRPVLRETFFSSQSMVS
jgi:hypothetical protein